jgi:hypothetical protein
MVRPRRVAQVAAVVLGVLALTLCVGTVVLDSLLHTHGTGGPVIEALSIGAAVIPAATVSALLAALRPGNPIGWLLFVILIIGASPTSEYDIWMFRMHHGSELLGRLSLAVQEAWPLLLAAVAVLLWVFPDGKLPGGRWRAAVRRAADRRPGSRRPMYTTRDRGRGPSRGPRRARRICG